jgi:hypothetical protein
MARYGAMGWAVPHHPPSTMSRLATFKIQECQCPGSGDATVWGQAAKLTW